MQAPRLLFRLGLATAAGLAVAFLVAIVVAVLDLYLVGHGRRSLLEPVLGCDGLGIALTAGDMAMLVAASLAGIAAWIGTRSGH